MLVKLGRGRRLYGAGAATTSSRAAINLTGPGQHQVVTACWATVDAVSWMLVQANHTQLRTLTQDLANDGTRLQSRAMQRCPVRWQPHRSRK
jgi:hypothetical protein